jgi:hypothetical protein
MTTAYRELFPITEDVPDDVLAKAAEIVAAGVPVEKLYVQVYSLHDPANYRGVKLGEIDLAAFSESKVAELYRRAGKYKGVLKSRSGTHNGSLKEWRFEIAESVIPATATPAAAGALGGFPMPPTNEPASWMLTMLMSVQQQQAAQQAAAQQRTHEMMLAMLGRQQQQPTGTNDRIIEVLLTQALAKTPLSDVAAMLALIDERRGERDEDDAPTGEGGVGFAREALKTLRALANAAPPHAAHANAANATAPTAQVAQIAQESAAEPGEARQSQPIRPQPQTQTVNFAAMSEIERLIAFGKRAHPALLECASDAEPDAQACAMTLAAIARRYRIDCEELAHSPFGSIIGPIVAAYPDLATHEAFLRDTWAAFQAEYAADDEEDQDEAADGE